MADLFVKTFKGYEDKTIDLDAEVNQWMQAHSGHIEIVDIKTVLSHETGGRAGSGDLIYTVLYRGKKPVD